MQTAKTDPIHKTPDIDLLPEYSKFDQLTKELCDATGISLSKAQKIITKYLTETSKQVLTYAQLDTETNNPMHCFMKSSELTNKLGRIYINKRPHWVWNVIQQLPSCPTTLIYKGNNLSGKMSVYKITQEFEDYVYTTGNYKQYVSAIAKAIDEESGDIDLLDVDLIPVDLASLRNFMIRIEHDIEKVGAIDDADPRIDQYLTWVKEARRFYMIGSVSKETIGKAVIPHYISESNFGRKYYKGPNLQVAPKAVRHAALGHCYSVDINSCMHVWKYEFAMAINGNVSEIIHVYDYLDRADSIRTKLAIEVFGTAYDWQKKLIKRVINAIALGARTRSGSYFSGGKISTFALSDIIKRKEYLDKLLATEWMDGFIKEQEKINQLIYDTTLEQMSIDEIREIEPRLVKKNGTVNKILLLSYLYQHYERGLVNLMEKVINEDPNNEVLLRVHDCIYIRSMSGVGEMKRALKEISPELKVGVVEINKVYNAPEVELEEDIQRHREFVANEERLAMQYAEQKQNFVHSVVDEYIDYIKKNPSKVNDKLDELKVELGISNGPTNDSIAMNEFGRFIEAVNEITQIIN